MTKMRLKFVDLGDVTLNPWLVTSITEDDLYVNIRTMDGAYHSVLKHKGDIIVNDKKAVISALETAVNSDEINE